MIRAVLVALAMAGPAGAATRADCTALLDRLGLEAETIVAPAQSCFYRGVTYGAGAMRWRAEVLALFGDVDALPDALPSRLTGGIVGLTRGAAADGQALPDGKPSPDADVARDEDAPPAPTLTVTFNVAAGGGRLRVDTLSLRTGGAGKADLTASLSGLPLVLPAEPRALGRMRLDALELDVEPVGLRDALADTLALTGLEPDALRANASAWLDAFAVRDGQADNAEALRRALDASAASGTLDATLVGTGVPLLGLLPLVVGKGLGPAAAARLARDADLRLTWKPDAP